MRILHLVNSLALGGAERLVAGLAPLQAAAGHEVTVACLDGRGGFFGASLEAAGTRVVALSARSPRDPRLLSGLRDFLRGERPEVLHVHLFPAQYLAALAATGPLRPPALVTTEHSTHNRRIGRAWLRGVERLVYGRYDALAAVSEAVAARYALWLGGATRILTVPNGVDLGLFHPAGGNRAPSREALGLPDGSFLACMAGRLEAPKEPGLLVEALGALPGRVGAVFAGEGSLRASCEARAAELGLAGRTTFLGRRDDLPELFRACDAFVLPSGYEGFGLAAVEAMATGLPCVLADLPALREVGGDAVLYFPPGDAAALGRALARLASEPDFAARLGEAARSRSAGFDLGTTSRLYLDLYAEILERKGPCPQSR